MCQRHYLLKDSIETSVEDDTKKEKKLKKCPGKWVGGEVPNDFNYQTRQRRSWCCGRVCLWCTACRHTAPALHSSTASIGLYTPYAFYIGLYPPYAFLYWPVSTIRIPILACIHRTYSYTGLYPPYVFLYWPISTIRIPILVYIHHTYPYIGVYPPYAFVYWRISTIRIPTLAYIHHTYSYIGLYPPYARQIYSV